MPGGGLTFVGIPRAPHRPRSRPWPLPPLHAAGESAAAQALLMMFLQFFIWGAWFELGFGYIPKLGFNGDWQTAAGSSGRSTSGRWSRCSSAPSSPTATSRPRSSSPSATWSAGWRSSACSSCQPATPDEVNGRVLAVLRADAGALALLRADDLDHQLDRVRQPEATRPASSARSGCGGRSAGSPRRWPFIFILVDWAKVPAIGDVGFVGLARRRRSARRSRARPAMSVQAVHLPRGRGRLAAPGRVQPDAAAHAAEAGRRARTRSPGSRR